MILRKILLTTIMTIVVGTQSAKAQSAVYFFVDFRFWNSEYVFKVNGEDGFVLKPEKSSNRYFEDFGYMYNMCARKVIFQHPDSYVISVECPKPNNGGTYQADVNLNLEDDETYYVLCNATMKRNFYMEVIPEKEGLKYLKKAQTSSKYTFNEDFVYENN